MPDEPLKTDQKEKVETLSDNYFKKVNSEFEKAMKNGEVMDTKGKIDEIKNRNEKSFIGKVFDAIKDPAEAMKWLGATFMASMAGSWIGEIFGAKKYLNDLKEGIMGRFRIKKKEKGAEGEKNENYGEMAPLKEAIPNFIHDIDTALLPLKRVAATNKEVLAALAAYYAITHPGQIAKAAFFSKDIVIGLAKLPFVMVRGFPLTSLFAVIAILMNRDKIQHLADIQIPKDTKNLKQYIKAHVAEAAEWCESVDVPNIPDAQVEIAADLLTGAKSISEYSGSIEEMIKNLLSKGAESVLLTPEKLIKQKNEKGLQVFKLDLEFLKSKSEDPVLQKKYEELIRRVLAVRKEILEGRSLSSTHITHLQFAAAEIDIQIFADDGYILWQKTKDGVVTEGPKHFTLDPGLKASEALQKAKRFTVSDEDTLEAVGKVPEMFLTELKLRAGEVFDGCKSIDEADSALSKAIQGGWQLAVVGTEVVLVGATEKYALGPYKLFKNIFKKATGDFSLTECLVDYAEGILPVIFLTIASSTVRLKFNELGFKNVILRSAAYPFTGTFATLRTTAKHVVVPLYEGKFREILSNPKNQLTSSARETLARYQTKYNRWFGSVDIANKRSNIASLEEALRNLYKALDYKTSLDPHLKEVRRVLDEGGIRGIEINNTEEGARKAIEEIKKRIGDQKNAIQRIAEEEMKKKNAPAEQKKGEQELSERKSKLEQEKARIREEYKGRKNAGEMERKIKEVDLEIQKVEEFYRRQAPPHPNAPEIKPGKAKKIGKGIGAALLGIGMAFGLGKGVQWIKEKISPDNETLDLEKIRESGEAKRKDEERKSEAEKMKSDPDFKKHVLERTQKTMEGVLGEMKQVDERYADLENYLKYENLKDRSEAELIKRVDEETEKHHKNIEHAKKIVADQREDIEIFCREYPDQFREKEKDVGKYISLGYDKKLLRPYIKYASASDFKTSVYDHADSVRRMEGKAPSVGDEVKNLALYAAPGIGTYMDGRDAVRALRRGQWGAAAWSGLMAVVGGVSDVLLVTGVGTAAGAAIRVGRGAVIAAKAAKASQVILKATKLERVGAHTGKVVLGSMGFDVGRSLFSPKFSDTYVF